MNVYDFINVNILLTIFKRSSSKIEEVNTIPMDD